MKRVVRLRSLSVGCIALAGIALAFEMLGHRTAELSVFIIIVMLLGTALEQIRLELRDLREELLTRNTRTEANAASVDSLCGSFQ